MQTLSKTAQKKLAEETATISPANSAADGGSNISRIADHRLKQAATEENKISATAPAIPHNTFFKSFYFAFQGIVYVVRTQRNMQVHLFAGLLVVIAGIFFGVTWGEWATLFAMMALVYSLEMVNTVAESIVDMVTREYHPLAKVAKDAAAGAVLVAAIFAVGVALTIFLPHFFNMLSVWFNWR